MECPESLAGWRGGGRFGYGWRGQGGTATRRTGQAKRSGKEGMGQSGRKKWAGADRGDLNKGGMDG